MHFHCIVEIDAIHHVAFYSDVRVVPRESEDFMLDEDDYMLLQDNNITGISRPKPVCLCCQSLSFAVLRVFLGVSAECLSGSMLGVAL